MPIRNRCFTIAGLTTLLWAGPLLAQQGTLIGTVRTESGLTVQAAQIDVGGGARATSALTDEQGRYRLALLAGTYYLVVTSIGARARRIDDVAIAAGQTTTLDIILVTRAEELDAVQVTVGRVPERQTEAVQTVHTVTNLEIEERPAQTLTDHLRTTPGVDIITEGLQSTNVVVRGYRLAGVPSLRVNLMHFIPATEDDVDHMEVVLGPGSALYGPNTADGVVHILTKSPLDSPGTTVTLGGGLRTKGFTQGLFTKPDGTTLFQGSFRSAWDLSDNFGFKVSGQYLKGDEWPYLDPTEESARQQAANPLTRPICIQDKMVRGQTTAGANAICDRVGIRDFEIERWSGEARADYRFAPDGTIVATYGRTDATGIEMTGLGAGQAKNWVYEFYQARVNKGRLFAQTYYNKSDAGDTYLLQDGMPLTDQSGLYVAQIQHGFGVSDGRMDFTYGLDYFGTRPRTKGTINGLYENDDNIDEWGVYLQEKTAITDQLDLVLAGRMDDHSLLANKVWSPRVGVVFKPTENQSFRLSYNRAFSTPSSLNYFLDISGGLAPQIGPLGYSLRAYGTGRDGWSLQPGGVTQIRSPFINSGQTLLPPPDASALWQAAVDVLYAQGAIPLATRTALLGIPAPTSAQVPWALVDPSTGSIQPLIGAQLPDVPPIRESYTETFELGWTDVIANRVQVSADVYRTKKNDFVSPLILQTPLMMLSGQQLVAYLTPYFGASNATALGAGLAQVPLGVVSSDQVDAQGADLIATYRNVGDVHLWGGDVSFEAFLTDDWTLSGSYSHVSEDYFKIPDGSPIALNAPKDKGSLGLAYRNVRAGFTGAARARFQSEFPAESAGYVGTTCVTGVPVGLFDEECVKAATILDLNFGYKVPTTDATVQLVIDNVLNTAYRSFVGVPSVRRLATLSVKYDLF
jgi:outer membrane receptor for ferrienterochelin and colicins